MSAPPPPSDLPRHALLEGAVLRPSGERAAVVEFGEAIEPRVQARVLALARVLRAAAPKGLVEAVPTYRSLLVEFDPARTDIGALLSALPPEGDAAPFRPRMWSVPVCVEGEMAEDADEARAELGLGADEFREALLGSVLEVGMYGFVPGFAYCSGLDPRLSLPRRQKPRPPVPPGSLIIANAQAGFVPVSMPTGWYVVGRTSVSPFDPAREPPVPFAVGDRLRLRAVGADELHALGKRADGGLAGDDVPAGDDGLAADDGPESKHG